MPAALLLVLNTLKDIALGLVMKIALKAVLERFVTRTTIYLLIKLKNWSTNQVADDTLQDIIDSLKNKKLNVIDSNEWEKYR